MLMAAASPLLPDRQVLPRRGTARRPAARFTQIDIETSSSTGVDPRADGRRWCARCSAPPAGIELADRFPSWRYDDAIRDYGIDSLTCACP